MSAKQVQQKRVFVLGAGFTRAFYPRAPLVKDHYGGEALQNKFKGFAHATRVLELELERDGGGQIDIERFMTRLDGLMPYDLQSEAAEELRLLLSDLKLRFVARIKEARKVGRRRPKSFASFAKYCLSHRITCVTFNYDDLLDQALWEVHRQTTVSEGTYWHPDGGYGFFCRPSESCIRDSDVFMDRPPMLLLKLHGSINWRPKLGYRQPYGVDAIVHEEEWLPLEDESSERLVISQHLDA
ncbi:MAG: hypothetical protein WBD55_06640, partial [Dehalococcoidia bacterium]